MKDFFKKIGELTKLKKEFNDVIKWKKKLKEKIMKQKNGVYNFLQYDTVSSFGEIIYNDKIDIKEAEMNQKSLIKNWHEYSEKSKPRTQLLCLELL